MAECSDDGSRLLAAEYIGKQLKALARHVKGARKGKDIECVHQLRVASRRIRGALQMFRACFPARKGKRWRKATRRLTLALGPVRDRDQGR